MLKRNKKVVTAIEAVKRRGLGSNACMAGAGKCPEDYGYENFCNDRWGKNCGLCWNQPVVFDEADSLENFIKEEME